MRDTATREIQFWSILTGGLLIKKFNFLNSPKGAQKTMSKQTRVLGRAGARELTTEEYKLISGGTGTHTLHVTGVPPILDAFGDFD
jgi:hypothetical protein